MFGIKALNENKKMKEIYKTNYLEIKIYICNFPLPPTQFFLQKT